MEPSFCVTKACPWSLPWARWIHSYHPICLRIISLVYFHLFLNHTCVHLLSEFLAWVFFIFLVYRACWDAMGYFPAVCFPEVKQVRHHAHHSPSPSTELQNGWRQTSTASCAFMQGAWLSTEIPVYAWVSNVIFFFYVLHVCYTFCLSHIP